MQGGGLSRVAHEPPALSAHPCRPLTVPKAPDLSPGQGPRRGGRRFGAAEGHRAGSEALLATPATAQAVRLPREAGGIKPGACSQQGCPWRV